MVEKIYNTAVAAVGRNFATRCQLACRISESTVLCPVVGCSKEFFRSEPNFNIYIDYHITVKC